MFVTCSMLIRRRLLFPGTWSHLCFPWVRECPMNLWMFTEVLYCVCYSEGASVLLSFTFTPFGYSEFSHCHLSRHFWARSMKGFTKVKPNQVKRGILISKKGFSSDGLSYTPNEANRYKDMRGSVAVFEFILNVKYQRNDAVQLWHQLQCTNNLAHLHRCHFGTHPASIFCIH